MFQIGITGETIKKCLTNLAAVPGEVKLRNLKSSWKEELVK
jgi:hypothetical protein